MVTNKTLDLIQAITLLGIGMWMLHSPSIYDGYIVLTIGAFSLFNAFILKKK